MDYIEKLAQQASQITMYDVKTYYNQAKNAVLNLSEMEAKVREATNDDPWGASSTLMQQIADGTHNFAQFNEIMPTIYSRFMEKEAREWRQIYKALTLLEFLVKNGSERVVDDARAHVSTIKMLRSFHYIDEKGKDQGINVRNRASEIAILLGDIDKIRQERRKAKANKTKYGGQGNDGGMSFVTASGGRYGGFGSDSLGGGGGGGSSGGYRGGGGGDYDSGDDYRRRTSPQAAVEYDEYEGADDFAEPRRTGSSSTNRTSRPQPPPKSTPKEPKAAEKPKEVNLFDFGDDEPAAAAAPSAGGGASQNILGGDGKLSTGEQELEQQSVVDCKDDFDDFQSAPTTTTTAPAAKPTPAPSNNANLFDLLNSGNAAKPSAPAGPAGGQRPPSYGNSSFTSPSASSPGVSMPAMAPAAPVSRPSYTSPPAASTPAALSPKATGTSNKSTFDDLFNTSLTSMGGTANGNAQKPGSKTMKDLEKEKAMNSLWGPSSSGGQASKPAGQGSAAKPSGGGGFDDLLM